VRIAVVNHHMEDVIGGSELQCHLVADGLTERGHEVTYVAVAAAAGAAPVARMYGYDVRACASEPSVLADSILATRPDVVYWRFNRRGLREVARALRAAGVPLVVALAHVDDVTPWPSWPWPRPGSSLRDRASDLRSRLRWRGQLAAYRDVTAIASQRSDLIGRIPLGTVTVQRHVPNAMDAALADGPPFIHPRPFVAWVGNLKPRKRPELIPVIADALAPHGVDLVVIGPAQDERYAWLTGPLSQHPNLHALGALPTQQVVSVLAAARCLAVTAMPEGFSNVMIQAWWGGTPTVTLDYDPDGLVRSEGLGSVAGGDVAGFVAGVVRLADGSVVGTEERRAAGARAAVLARTRFAQEVVLDALEQLLRDVIDHDRGRA
jgi:glycosyltransferase involved in cell wall biosynthesis